MKFTKTPSSALVLLLISGCTDTPPPEIVKIAAHEGTDTQIASLETLSLESLRQRSYGSAITVHDLLGDEQERQDYLNHFSADGSSPYPSYSASYLSDGLLVGARIDVPAAEPSGDGYPIVVFVHGWYGLEGAKTYDHMFSTDSAYSRAIDAYVDAGFMVVSPALRGHGQVNGKPAEGIEFVRDWDNGSYLSPMFYAIDVLNLVDSLDEIDWGRLEIALVDLRRIHIAGQSQGGDAVLTALAVSGEGSMLANTIATGSIWSGCFGTRFAQAELYGPMSNTLEAFMSGDGSWTGTARGHDGSVNPNFAFAWPPDWIGTVDINSHEWTWQADHWSVPSVAESLRAKYTEMYNAVNRGVADIDDATFEIHTDTNGRAQVVHDQRLIDGMTRIGAFEYEQYLTEPLLLHHSDRDYYSIPEWNADLARRINQAGGHAYDFTYAGNTHGLTVSEHEWFSPPGTIEGFELMLARDIALMNGADPVAIDSVK